MRGALALLLSYAIGVQPAVAQYTIGRVAVPAVSGVGAPAAAGASVQPLQLTTLGVAPAFSLSAAPTAPGAFSAPAASAVSAAPALASPAALPAAAAALASPVAAARAAAPVAALSRKSAFSPAEKLSPAARVGRIGVAAEKAVNGLDKASGAQARGQADEQFAALTETGLLAASAGDETPAPSGREGADAPRTSLDKPTAPAEGASKTDVPAPKAPKMGLFTVFRDPARNSAFWRYVSGYAIFLFGFEMYVVGMPYLISSMTTNSLKEHKDARLGNDEAVKELIRSNRSLSRIAHWAAQGVSYIAIPLFTRNQEKDGPRKWLVKSMLIRAGVLAAVPAVFFATGVIGLQAAMWALFGLIAAQAFFQGISVTAEGAATTRLLGAKDVTTEERTKANSILTVLASVIAIIGPLVAGQIALIGPVKGKAGVGGAVIYGIYAGAIALTGLIYATIKMFGGQSEAAKAALARGEAASSSTAPKTFKGVMKELWVSIKDGSRIVFKDRLLRTMLILSMVGSLFSDPLVFNVLPEYIEGLVAKNPGSISAIMGIPGVGWFLKTLSATPMGNFAMMMVMASVGSIVATLLMKPMTKLFHKFGFKTEEALTIPFYFLAALEAPLFFLMIHTPTMLGAIALYGLQALATGFIGISIQGLYQKKLGDQKDGDVNKILAADSLLGIGAAIISTFAYGFLLKNIPIATSLWIAAIATGVVALIRIAAPFLSFTKDQRKPPAPPSGPSVPAHALPSTGAHNGANSIQSTNL
jgi:MFS family permease